MILTIPVRCLFLHILPFFFLSYLFSFFKCMSLISFIFFYSFPGPFLHFWILILSSSVSWWYFAITDIMICMIMTLLLFLISVYYTLLLSYSTPTTICHSLSLSSISSHCIIRWLRWIFLITIITAYLVKSYSPVSREVGEN